MNAGDQLSPLRLPVCNFTGDRFACLTFCLPAMIRRLRAWAAARRAERRALAEYRGAWRNLARLRNSPEGQRHAQGRPGGPGASGGTDDPASHTHRRRLP